LILVEIVKDIKSILIMNEPYIKIPTLSLLIEKYNYKILSLLEEESIPVKQFIEISRNEVFETLEQYEIKEKYSNNIIDEFYNLTEIVKKANSFAVLSSMRELAEKLKLKWTKY